MESSLKTLEGAIAARKPRNPSHPSTPTPQLYIYIYTYYIVNSLSLIFTSELHYSEGQLRLSRSPVKRLEGYVPQSYCEHDIHPHFSRHTYPYIFVLSYFSAFIYSVFLYLVFFIRIVTIYLSYSLFLMTPRLPYGGFYFVFLILEI